MKIQHRANTVHNGESVYGYLYPDQIAKGGYPCVDVWMIRHEDMDYEVREETITVKQCCDEIEVNGFDDIDKLCEYCQEAIEKDLSPSREGEY